MYQTKGAYNFKGKIPADGVRRELRDLQVLENGDLYYGFWYF